MTLICLFMDICYQHLLTSWHHPALSVYRLLRVSQCDIDSSMSKQCAFSSICWWQWAPGCISLLALAGESLQTVHFFKPSSAHRQTS